MMGMRAFSAAFSSGVFHEPNSVISRSVHATSSEPFTRDGMLNAAASSGVAYQPAKTRPSREGIGSPL